MYRNLVKLFAVLACAGALLAACGGSGMNGVTPLTSLVPAASPFAAGTNVVQNGTFDTGKLKPWTNCGTAAASISKKHPQDGKYDALTGSKTTKKEVKGWSAICQQITIPSKGTLSAWLYQQTNEPNEKKAYQEVALASSKGKPTVALTKGNANHAGWVHQTWNLSKYAGKSETLFFGVYGSGRKKFYDTQFIDNVSLTGKGSTPSPTPSSSPTPGALTANPTSLTFSSETAQTFVAQESGYSGTLTASSSDTTVATVSPSSGSGPSATFTVTPVGGGTETITVSDASGHTATVAVTVDNGVIIINRKHRHQ